LYLQRHSGSTCIITQLVSAAVAVSASQSETQLIGGVQPVSLLT